MAKIVMVTGSRKWPWKNQYQIEQALIEANPGHLIVGDAKGADFYAREWAERTGTRYTVFSANWKRYGRGAGPIRNQDMIDWNPELVLAFPIAESTGTVDAIVRAKKKGIEVITIMPAE